MVRSEVTAIYCGSLEGFVARRTALAEKLRSSDAGAAADVRRLRKPPVSAWAIDQLGVENPDLLTELLAAGADAGEAQRSVSDGVGSGEDLLIASARVREAVDAAARAATAVLDRVGHATGEATARRIRTTLQAAVSGGPDERLALWSGTLDRDLEPTGFGALDSLEDDVPELAAVLAPLRRAPSAEGGRAATHRTRRPDDLASLRAAERAAAQNERGAAQARAIADAKRQHAERLAGEARRAEGEAAAAEAAADTAEEAARIGRAALPPQ